MNVRNKILIALFALGTICMWGCDSLIFDDMADCPQGVYVKFYSKTPCDVDSTFLGEVSDLHLFAFNENDVLVSATSRKDVALDRDFEILMPVSNGYFTFIGWAGINNLFSVADFKEGVTTKQDVMFTLKTLNNHAEFLGNHKVWQGNSPVVVLQDPAVVGSEFKHTAVNLREVTNRVNIEVEFHESIQHVVDPRDYTVEIYAANGTMNINGTLPRQNAVLNYPAITRYASADMWAMFTVLDLKTGYEDRIVIKNTRTGEVIWQSSLIGSILLKNDRVNLDCQHDFDVKFVIRDKCFDCGTYVCWAIYVNNWQVHSYETDLGGGH